MSCLGVDYKSIQRQAKAKGCCPTLLLGRRFWGHHDFDGLCMLFNCRECAMDLTELFGPEEEGPFEEPCSDICF